MEEELKKEFQCAARQHILVYGFLLRFYQQQKVFDEKVYAQIKKYCSVLKTLTNYNEQILIRSTFNIGILLAMFDRCASPMTQTFFTILKKSLVKKMKKLKYLKRNTASYRKFLANKKLKRYQKAVKVKPVKSAIPEEKVEHDISDNSDNVNVHSNDELIKKIKGMFNITYSEKVKAKYAERKLKEEQEDKEEQQIEDKTGRKRKLKRKSWSHGVIPKQKSRKIRQKRRSKSADSEQGDIIDLDDEGSQKTEDYVDLISEDEFADIRPMYRTGNKNKIPDKMRKSVFTNYETMNFDTTRKISAVNAMKEMLPKLKPSITSNIKKLLKKLHLTSSNYDYKLPEMNTIDHGDLLQTYEDLQLETFYNTQNIPSNFLSKDIMFSVGPIQVRCFDEDLIYTCAVEGCKSKKWHTTKLSLLHRHIQAIHLDVKFNWFCTLCPCVDVSFYQLTDYSDVECAFHHLVSKHVFRKKDANYLLEKYQEKNGSYIPPQNKEEEKSDGIKIISFHSLNPEFSGEGYNKVNKISEVPKLFQCPVSGCIFTSDSELMSFQHFLNEFDGIELHKCTYCERNFADGFSYCSHILEEHGMDKYQCSYCSYRSVSKSNVIHHQMDLHTCNSVRVLVGKDKKELLASFPAKEVSISIMPYKCEKKDCGFQTNVVRFFLDHLTNSHKQSMLFTCQCCYFVTKIPSALIEHMPEHGLGEYECKYCPFGSNNVQAIRRHMYQIHASRHPFCYQRAAFETESDRINKQYKNISITETDFENLILIDLDTSIAESFWDSDLINVEEYEKSLNTGYGIEINEEVENDIELIRKQENLIVLSDSDTEKEVKTKPVILTPSNQMNQNNENTLPIRRKPGPKSRTMKIDNPVQCTPPTVTKPLIQTQPEKKKNVAKKSTTRNGII